MSYQKIKSWLKHMFIDEPVKKRFKPVAEKKITPKKKKTVAKKKAVAKKKDEEDTAEEEGKMIYSGNGNSVIEKPVRTRTIKGKYVSDDPLTEDYNEAWVGGKAPMKNKPTITRKKSKL